MAATSEAAKQRQRALNKGLYFWYRDHGICPDCRKAYAEGGKVLCRKCAKHRLAVRYHNDPGGEKHKQYSRERRERLKAEGICIDCGRAPARDGGVRCVTCNKKRNESIQAYKLRKRIRNEAKKERAKLCVT